MQTTRLQTIIPKADYREYKEIAKDMGISLADWVRQTLKKGTDYISSKNGEKKLRLIEEVTKWNIPGASGDIDQILKEIEQGYLNNGYEEI